ncbi:MAG: formylglycine-generating enzyme family protein, partial [Blastocatellia bacterium]
VMGDKLKPHFKGDDLPMESISWEEAKEFCQKIQQLTNKAYRLPSEAEWEYACRAGTTGDYGGKLDEMAWYYENSDSKTHPVGKKNANSFGLYDMHGNVWEWCEDLWHDDYKQAPADGSAWLSGGDSSRRVLRGGSWNLVGSLCRSAYRHYVLPGNRFVTFGFVLWCQRGLRTLEPSNT